VDELIRRKMHGALEVEQPAADLRSRILSALPANEPRMRRVWTLSGQWAIGFVAVLLAIAVVGGLLYSRGALPISPASPASPKSGLPAHGRIAFTMQFGPPGCGSSGHMCDYGNIFSIEPNGTGLRRLTNVATGLDQDPDWSPTGDRIVFDVAFPLGSGGYEATSSNIFSMDANGGSMRQLTSEPTGVFDGDPVISPDGNRIAFERFDLSGRLTGIWLMNGDGSNIVRVTMPPASAAGGDQRPDFSPDGTQLTFDRDGSDNGDAVIYIVGIDGKGLRQVTPTSFNLVRPRWSPDGSKLVFSNPQGAGPSPSRNIYVINSDGNGLLALTHMSYPGFAGGPAWSPDGTMIVYDVYTGTDSIQLAVMHADGSNPIVIWHQAPSTNFFAASAGWGTAQ
jgi:Tol biopolymer transport system component